MHFLQATKVNIIVEISAENKKSFVFMIIDLKFQSFKDKGGTLRNHNRPTRLRGTSYWFVIMSWLKRNSTLSS